MMIASRSIASVLRSRLVKPSSVMRAGYATNNQQSCIDTHEVFKDHFLRQFERDNALRDSMAYSLSFADDEMAFELFDSMKNKRMEEQLRISQSQLRSMEHPEQPLDRDPLPRTFRELRSPTSRPIVVTHKDMPFSIVEVNQAWEGLCGYGYAESYGKSLGTLLQGPETDMASVTAMMSQLLRGEEAGTVLTNYTKDGRRFRNRLRVGPLLNDAGETTHFVGVLQEIQDGM